MKRGYSSRLITKGQMLWLLLDSFLVAISLVFNYRIIQCFTLILWLNMLLYTLADLKKRSVFFAFLISFFMFLIGRETLEAFNLHTIQYYFPDAINQHAEILVFVALCSVSLTYIIFNKYKFTFHGASIRHEITNFDDPYILTVQSIARVAFYIAFIFSLYSLYAVVKFVSQHGYVAYYISYSSNVPLIIRMIGQASEVCFWVYMATMPPKKKTILPMVLYIIYYITSLGTGKRFAFVASLLSLFVYLNMRNYVNNKGEVWLSKKIIVTFFLGAPLLMILLNIYNYIRFDENIANVNAMDMLTDFIYRQGVSVNVIKRGEVYASSLPRGKFYILGETFETISNSLFGKLLGINIDGGNTAGHALNGYSFAHAISYVVIGEGYLMGYGIGSSYIAEAYHDLRLFGVIIINIIYGIIFSKLYQFKINSIWKTAISYIILESFLFAPRGSCDGALSTLVSFSTWGTLLLLYLITKYFYEIKSRKI